jgi:hypothetical protein
MGRRSATTSFVQGTLVIDIPVDVLMLEDVRSYPITAKQSFVRESWK